LKTLLDKAESIMQLLNEAENTVKDATMEARQATEPATGAIEEAKEQRAISRDTRGTIAGRSYAAALRCNIPPSHSNNLARESTRGCQIQIDKDPLMDSSTLYELMEEELVAKASEAIS
jgi:hypothetical protein